MPAPLALPEEEETQVPTDLDPSSPEAARAARLRAKQAANRVNRDALRIPLGGASLDSGTGLSI